MDKKTGSHGQGQTKLPDQVDFYPTDTEHKSQIHTGEEKGESIRRL